MERAHKYEFEGKVRYSEIDHRATMTLPALINYFQDCSTFQSEQLGYGMDVLKKEKKAWVLAYWQVIVKRYPKLCERITVGTFASGFKGMFGNRNFYMKDESGEQIACANSIWVDMDVEKGKPVRVDKEHELILFGIPYPVVIVKILTAPIDVDTFHSCVVCFYQIFVFATQANPSERTVAIIKELGSHNIFNIAWPDKSVLFINTITGDFFYSGIVYGFHEGVSIIKEISSAGYEFLDNFEMTMQGYIYQVTELFRRFVKKAGAFFKS